MKLIYDRKCDKIDVIDRLASDDRSDAVTESDNSDTDDDSDQDSECQTVLDQATRVC